MPAVLGLDIGSNSVGSAWIDVKSGKITTGLSIFPAGVDEADDKRGEPKNAKRRATRRARITLARRAVRKRRLRLRLIAVGLLPTVETAFKKLLEETDPWELRRKGLTERLTPSEFGRVLLHLAQRRGAMGFDAEVGDKGKVKGAIVKVQMEMLDRFAPDGDRKKGQELKARIEVLGEKKKRTDDESEELEAAQEELKALCRSLLEDKSVSFGRLIAELRTERCTPITSEDLRKHPKGPREWHDAVRNRGGEFKFHADRAMIRDEFAKLWNAQKTLGGPLADILTDELRLSFDQESGNATWRHKGDLFGQRRQSWDLGTLGRCVLEPTERCAPHADMYASRYLVVETVNNLKIVERGKDARPLTPEERTKIKDFLRGPLGIQTKGKQKGQAKKTVSVSDLRDLMGWGRATKTSQFRLNIEADEERDINTDWFHREVVHGPVTIEKWHKLTPSAQDGLNRAILKHDPDHENDAAKLKALVMQTWAGLDEAQADALVAAWKKRPRLDAKRLNMSRRAVRNLLTVMDCEVPWPDPNRPGQTRWVTQIEARKIVAGEETFCDVTTGKLLDDHARRRYATGTKGATARDRHYMRKHLLKRNGELIFGPDGNPLHEPPPAPMISNPVVRKAIHEVRRHLVDYLIKFGQKPDVVYVELSREAKMGKVESDKLLFKNRLRNRIRRDIIAAFELDNRKSSQQRAAVDRVILAAQQRQICPLCGNQDQAHAITPRNAANGVDCEVAHIIPQACGGNNSLNNIVLAHTKCNRDMGRQTPRQFWESTGGFELGMSWIEQIFGNVERPKPSEQKSATGNALWLCYFNKHDDDAKMAQFQKDVKDEKGMTLRQDAATKYAARQVMAYIADALYDGHGLPERGGDRRIFATDGIWTSRLRREWGLFIDKHEFKATGISDVLEQERKQKNRGDHRHHAIDAVAIALSTAQVQNAWREREQQAENANVNTADQEGMAAYRRQHPLKAPAPFTDSQQLHAAVKKAVYGVAEVDRPVAHRPVKRKLIGALHEEILRGPVIDRAGKLTEFFTAKKSVMQLDPNHLRMPQPESRTEAVKRLTQEFKSQGVKLKDAKTRAETVVGEKNFKPEMIDPPPGRSGIVRDVTLRQRLRQAISEYRWERKNRDGEVVESQLLDPDNFTANEIKQAVEAGAIRQASGVPIRSVVLLWTMNNPVLIARKRPDYASNRMVPDDNPASMRAYLGGNNHHIEIRAAKNKKGGDDWSGLVVTTFEASQRKIRRLRAISTAGIPKPYDLRKLPKNERKKWRSILREIELSHPLIDRSDTTDGRFVMSLCEGETLFMRHKKKGELGYFVVAKLNKSPGILLVPHWDARPAGEQKDAEGKTIPDSAREEFMATLTDLKELAPTGHPHAVKVRVGPLGDVKIMTGD